jgi:putative ABC transport system permease protein
MTRAELRENLMVAIETLRSHKVRSTLTVLGIVIGVTSVISVAAIIEGLNLYIQSQVAALGSRTYFIARFSAGTDPSRMPERMRIRKYLQYTDAAYLRQAAPFVTSVTTFGTRAFFFGDSNEIRFEGHSVERVIVRGVEPEYVSAVPIFSVANGRFITNYDVEHASPVVVLGHNVAESLFPDRDPLGKFVRLNGKPYEVIGVFEPYPGLFGGPGVDEFAIIPLSDFHKNYPEQKELIIAFSVPKEVSIDIGRNQVIEAMRRLRKVPHSAENDFEIISPDFLADLWDKLTGALVILTGIISAMGLLVGGIGVMNIMLISVTERTQEIGVRKAIGARKSDIRVQFLLEAVMVTLVGGIIGIVLGMGVSLLVRVAAPAIPATVSLVWIFLGFAISVSVGLFFGFYPANRAANLDPIVCLRYE